MSKTFMKYLWLIDVLKSHGKMTLEQINEEWKNCYLNETKKDIPLRTFHNYVDAIQDIFKFITITCDRKDGYKYRIEENNYYQGKQTLNLLSSLFLNLKTASNKRLKNKVCDFDLLNAATPKVMDNLLEAIEKNKIVTLWKVFNLDPAITDENKDEKIYCNYQYKSKYLDISKIENFAPKGIAKVKGSWFVIGNDTSGKRVVYLANGQSKIEITGIDKITKKNDLNIEAYAAECAGKYDLDKIDCLSDLDEFGDMVMWVQCVKDSLSNKNFVKAYFPDIKETDDYLFE